MKTLILFTLCFIFALVEASTCPTDFKEFNHSDGSSYCYRFFYDQHTKDWHRTNCESLGAKLLTLHSLEEQRFVHEHITSNRYASWLDLELNTTTGEWEWYDGSPFDFENWDDNRNYFFISSTRLINHDLIHTLIG